MVRSLLGEKHRGQHGCSKNVVHVASKHSTTRRNFAPTILQRSFAYFAPHGQRSCHSRCAPRNGATTSPTHQSRISYTRQPGHGLASAILCPSHLAPTRVHRDTPASPIIGRSKAFGNAAHGFSTPIPDSLHVHLNVCTTSHVA